MTHYEQHYKALPALLTPLIRAKQKVCGLSYSDICEILRGWDTAREGISLSPPLYLARPDPTPLPMLLHCPLCAARHVDVGEFATKAHHTHACQNCGHVWRPAIVNTVGVQFLPGYRNALPQE